MRCSGCCAEPPPLRKWSARIARCSRAISANCASMRRPCGSSRRPGVARWACVGPVRDKEASWRRSPSNPRRSGPPRPFVRTVGSKRHGCVKITARRTSLEACGGPLLQGVTVGRPSGAVPPVGSHGVGHAQAVRNRQGRRQAEGIAHPGDGLHAGRRHACRRTPDGLTGGTTLAYAVIAPVRSLPAKGCAMSLHRAARAHGSCQPRKARLYLLGAGIGL